MREPEEKIPLQSLSVEVYFVVDCPFLHIVANKNIDARRQSAIPTDGLYEFERSPSLCPECGHIVTKTRKLSFLHNTSPQGPSSSVSNVSLTLANRPERFGTPSPSPDPTQHPPRYHRTTSADTVGSWQFFTPPELFPAHTPEPRYQSPSSSLPEPVSFLQVIDGKIEDPRSFPIALTTPPSTEQQQQQLNSSSSSSKSRFNLKWPGSKTKAGRREPKDSKPKSIYSVDSAAGGASNLPKFLSFAFSLTGRNLLIWKKYSEALVRIELDKKGGRLIDLGALLPGGADGDKSVNIRFVTEGDEWIVAVVSHDISHTRRLSLMIFHSSGLKEHSSLYPLNDESSSPQEPLCLSVSPNNRYIAVGLGWRVLLFCYQGADQNWVKALSVPNFAERTTIRFQAASFAADSSCVVVSTQVQDVSRRSESDDAVYTYVWPCQQGGGGGGGWNQPYQSLWPCRMPTDGQGLTSIHYHPSLSLALVTGLTATPYPLFLSPSNQPPTPIPPTVADFRIRSCCASPPATATAASNNSNNSSSNVLYFLDARNKVHRADLRTQSVRQVADLHTARGALKPQEEPAALAATAEGHLRVFWRQGAGLWLVDAGERVAPQKTNLRDIWLDAVGDG